jgi:hypothetical protein
MKTNTNEILPVNPLTECGCKNARTLHAMFGELIALKWIRQITNVDLLRAKNALADILANESWTYPHAKADLNDRELPRGVRRVALPSGWAMFIGSTRIS